MKPSLTAERWSRTVRAVVFLPLLALYAPALLAPAVGLFHDDGLYVVTAKALAEGEGYRIVSLPVEVPQTKFPILFPFALSLVWDVQPSFPDNVLLLKLVPFLALLVWCAVVHLLLREEAGDRTASAIVWLTLASPWVLFLATTLLSETLFAALCWGALLLLRRHEKRDAGRLLIGAAILSAAAALTRTIGVVLIAAGVVALIRRRRLAAAVTFALLAGALVAPWVIWARVASAHIPVEAGYYSSANYLSWNVLWNFAWPEKLQVVGWNAIYALLSPGWLLGAFSAQLIPLVVALGVLTYGGFLVHMIGRLNVIHWFFMLYLGVVLLWAWPPTRFLAPLYPLLLLLAWEGLRGALRLFRVRRMAARGVVLAVTVLAGAGAFWALGTASLQAARAGTVSPSLACSDDWADFEAATSWLQEYTAPNAVLLGNLDPLLYLYTGRKAVRAFEADPVGLYYGFDPDRGPLGPASALADRMLGTGADYLVETPGRCFGEVPFLERQIAELRERYPDALTEQQLSRVTESRIYRIDASQLRDTGAVQRPPRSTR